jgi:hypothetical protein
VANSDEGLDWSSLLDIAKNNTRFDRPARLIPASQAPFNEIFIVVGLGDPWA